MLKLAVFGHPVAHSLSPRIHSRFAESLGLAVDYRAIDCPAGQLARVLRAFREQGGCGCNLTVPLKAEGLELADVASQAARAAGAANTLVWRDSWNGSGWQADNTDGAGLIADLRRLGIDLAGRRVLVLGAGGAVAGILGPLLATRPARVCVLNRNLARAWSLVDRFGAARNLDAGALADGPGGGEFDLLIQGTSLGHRGECPFIDPGWLASGAVGYDLNYGPAHRPLAERLAELGVRSHSGLGMLIEQAAAAFEQFTGKRPATAEIHAAMVGRSK